MMMIMMMMMMMMMKLLLLMMMIIMMLLKGLPGDFFLQSPHCPSVSEPYAQVARVHITRTTSNAYHVHPMLLMWIPPRWPSDKASASRAEDPGVESRLRQDLFGVESYQ